MIRQITDSVDDLIDQFETEWSPTSASLIQTKLEQFGLTDNELAITELVRIDIERRYSSGLTCRLNDYFAQFPQLLDHPQRASEVAFEDYRVCTQLGHPIPVNRYCSVPGIEKQAWYQQFQQEMSSDMFTVQPGWDNGALGSASLKQDVSAPFGESELSRLQQIGFEPVQQIGTGAFSEVYLARQNDLASRYVVLKVVRQPRGEPQMMAMLQHTNIVPIYSYHFVDSYAIICMPYAGGVTLDDYLQPPLRECSRDGASLIQTIRNDCDETVTVSRDVDGSGPVTLEPTARLGAPSLGIDDDVATPLQRLRSLNKEQLAVWMFERLAGALAHSHARGVLHGDIKPANVLIRNDGEPALMDFNLSRSLSRVKAGAVGGTLAYMSPETLQRMMNDHDRDDERSDIYSLGMMLYEFLTGGLPYPRPVSQADIDIEAAIKTRRQPLVRPTEHPISDSLWSIVQKCLAYDPSQRYQSADQLQLDLQRQSQDRPLAHAPEASSERVAKWLRRHPRSTSAVSVTTLALLCLLPLLWAAVGWRASLVQAEATASFGTFVEQSNQALLTMMADPQRFEAWSIRELMVPLQTNDMLQPKTIDAIVTPSYLDSKSIQQRREVFVRHLVSTAIMESECLRRDPRPNKSLDNLSELIETAKYALGSNNSRSVMFLDAKLAEFSGQPERAERLSLQAEQSPIMSDNEYYLEALRLMVDRKWSTARDMLGALADRNAVPVALRWTTLGRAQLRLGELENARLSFTQSIERAPNSSRLWLLRATCSGKLGDLGRAESDIKQAMAIEPTLVETNYNLAMVYMKTDRVQAAIELLTTGLKHNPDQFPLLLLRSRAYSRLGEETAAKRDHDRAMSLSNLRGSTLVLRAQARLNETPPDYQGALTDLLAADQLAPETPAVMQQMAFIYVQLGQVDTAIELLQKVGAREPDNEKAIIYLAVLLAREKRYSEAIDELHRALEGTNKAAVVYQAACVYALMPDQKSHIRALRHLSIAIQRGYGSKSIAEDSDLDSLRHMPGFQSILQTTRLGKIPAVETHSSIELLDEFPHSEL